MKLDKAVRAELWYVAAGLIVCDAALCVVFALIGKFDYTVPLGALWGSVFAFLRMYLLARRVQKLSNMEAERAQQSAKGQLAASYYGRIMLMVFAIVIGVVVPWFHYIAVLIPFLVPQPVLLLRRALGKRKTQMTEGES